MDTIGNHGNCQRLVFTVGVCQHVHKITNLLKFELNRSSTLRDNNERKNTLVTRSCVLSRLDFETSNSKLEVPKSNSWKITSFAKTTSLQRKPFLTMSYTINLSPLLVSKWGFMLIIILSNYQWCLVPFQVLNESLKLDGGITPDGLISYNVKNQLFSEMWARPMPVNLHFMWIRLHASWPLPWCPFNWNVPEQMP